MPIINLADCIESNNKTVRENNLSKSHQIKEGTLVEVNWENGDYNGIRLFIVLHERDCDGTPLYSLSFDKNIGAEINEIKLAQQKSIGNAYREYNALIMTYRQSLLTGITEDSLTVIE